MYFRRSSVSSPHSHSYHISYYMFCSAHAERVLGTSSRYTTKTPLILLKIQPTPHFKIHKNVIRLLIVSWPHPIILTTVTLHSVHHVKLKIKNMDFFTLFTGFRPQKDVNKRKNLWVSPMCIKVLLFYNGMVLELH